MGVKKYLIVLVAGTVGLFSLMTTYTGMAVAQEQNAFQINFQVVKEAKISEFKVFRKNWQNKETLHYKISLQNASSQVHRYRIMISIPGGESVGGLLPRKAKNKFEPGEEMTFVYPVLNCTKIPEKVSVRVSLLD